MTIFFLLLAGLTTVLLGRAFLHRWFNHLFVFAGLWTISLVLLDLRMLRYYPLQWETWLLIAAAWCSFVLGAIVVGAVEGRRAASSRPSSGAVDQSVIKYEQTLLLRAIWILSAIALLATIQHWYVLLQKFGSIPKIILMANIIYAMRVADELPGMIPYLDSLVLIAILFGGMITAASGRLRMAAIVPLVIIFLAEMAMMGRARLILSALLFAAGYVTYKIRVGTVTQRKGSVLRKAIIVVLVAALFATAMEAVRSTRGMMETLSGASRALSTLEKASFITPSIYLYITVNHVVFDQYLKDGVERPPVGSNTFAPIYRTAVKLGAEIDAERYQRFYLTPYPTNTGTYLKEFHADFGLLGMLIAPFLISAVTSVLFLRIQRRFRLLDVLLLGYMYCIIGMSLFYVATRNGGLLAYLIIGTLCAIMLDRLVARRIGGGASHHSPATG